MYDNAYEQIDTSSNWSWISEWQNNSRRIDHRQGKELIMYNIIL